MCIPFVALCASAIISSQRSNHVHTHSHIEVFRREDDNRNLTVQAVYRTVCWKHGIISCCTVRIQGKTINHLHRCVGLWSLRRQSRSIIRCIQCMLNIGWWDGACASHECQQELCEKTNSKRLGMNRLMMWKCVEGDPIRQPNSLVLSKTILSMEPNVHRN